MKQQNHLFSSYILPNIKGQLCQRFTILLLLVCYSFTSNGQLNDSIANTPRPEKWAIPVNEVALKNFYKIDSGIYRSAQPDKNAIRSLEDFGIKNILNLRYWNSDNKEAAGSTVNLYRVRMNAHDIDEEDIVEALQIIKNRDGDIVIHCKHGSDRTGVICAMYRIIFQNWTKEEAIDEMRNGGYGFHEIYSNIPKYIEKVDIDKIRQELRLIQK